MNKGIIALIIVSLLVGYMIGFIHGSYATANWVAEKAVYFFELEGNELNITIQELAAALGRYRRYVDGMT